ncbi:MAG: GNAT family N-acetyltransferase [Colwellia sp.]
MMFSEQLSLWFSDFKQQALAQYERRLVVLSGEESWALSLLQSISVVNLACDTSTQNKAPNLIYGDSDIIISNVQYKRFFDKLGSESETIIFADSAFNIDALAALSGTLVAGGILFLVLKNDNDSSRFLTRLLKLTHLMPQHVIIKQKQTDNFLKQLNNAHTDYSKRYVAQTKSDELPLSFPFFCITAEQVLAVNAITKVALGHRKRPLILTADRGRGKSSALAIACAQLFKTTEIKLHIIVTAPNFQALAIFFKQLSNSLPSALIQGSKVTYDKSTLEFIAIDQLINEFPSAGLLLVDEAAAIPVYLLTQLLANYHRTVFASTVHGYEGAGRGFTLKFQQVLTKKCPQWRKLHLNQPIRWRENDPLEKLIFDSCLLNAELESFNEHEVQAKSVDLTSLAFTVYTPNSLINDEVLLSQLFAVLVTAHYQTKPSDLKMLLDNPNVKVVCLHSCDFKQKKIVAVALLITEGKTTVDYSSKSTESFSEITTDLISNSTVNSSTANITNETINAITNSQRRLKNHFIPQSLLTHCGVAQAFNYQYLRVMRIAVHPQLQQQSIGSHFIDQISVYASHQNIDFVGASFGVTKQLLSFWLAASFQTMRIGFTKDKASGEHSALVLKAVSVEAHALQKNIHYQFYRSFDHLLVDEYKELPTDLVVLLLCHCPPDNSLPLTAIDLANVKAFAQGQRQYSSCVYSLYLWLKYQLTLFESTQFGSTNFEKINFESTKETVSRDDMGYLVLIARIMQKHSVPEVCQRYGFTGKRVLNDFLKAFIGKNLEQNSKLIGIK